MWPHRYLKIPVAIPTRAEGNMPHVCMRSALVNVFYDWAASVFGKICHAVVWGDEIEGKVDTPPLGVHGRMDQAKGLLAEA